MLFTTSLPFVGLASLVTYSTAFSDNRKERRDTIEQWKGSGALLQEATEEIYYPVSPDVDLVLRTTHSYPDNVGEVLDEAGIEKFVQSLRIALYNSRNILG